MPNMSAVPIHIDSPISPAKAGANPTEDADAQRQPEQQTRSSTTAQIGSKPHVVPARGNPRFDNQPATTTIKSTTTNLIGNPHNQTLHAGQGSIASAAPPTSHQVTHNDTTSEPAPTSSSIQEPNSSKYPAAPNACSTSHPLPSPPPGYPPHNKNTNRPRSSTNPHPQNYIQDPFAMEMTAEQRLRNELSSSSASSSNDPLSNNSQGPSYSSSLPYAGGGGGEEEGGGVLATAGKYLREGKEKVGRVEEMVWKRIGEGGGE